MGMITIAGVGLEAGQMTLDVVRALSGGAKVVLHTGRIGCAGWLQENGIPFETLDHLYETCEDFDQHAEAAADYVIERAQENDVVYAVYDVRDRSAVKLAQRNTKLRVLAGPPVEGALLARLDGATRMLEASDWENFNLSARENALVRELNSRELTSEVKLKLMECYPDETRCFLLNGDGSVARVPLYDLDRLKSYDHRSCALIPAQQDLTKLQRYSFDELVQIMSLLQGPDGCPWDRAQTHESLCPCMLEETYECIDAIREGDPDHLYDELGDLLMQVVMHAEIARSHGEFDITDATTAICEKMIARHTHIFGSDSAQTPEGVLDLWAANKMKERGQQTYTETLQEIVRSLPALLRARKLASKAASAGVKQTDAGVLARDAAACMQKIENAADPAAALGDALFMACAWARAADVDPELALNAACDGFVRRFEALEKELAQRGESMPVSPECAGKYWDCVKLR